MEKLYPDSGVELAPFTAKHYDFLMRFGSIGKYKGFISRAIRAIEIDKNDTILDLGCGTGSNACLMADYLASNGKAELIGLDVSGTMEKQFRKNCAAFPFIHFKKMRIDQPFQLGKQFDKVFISFVLHGFPHEIRQVIIQNAMDHLKPGGTFNILDFAEFSLTDMPFTHRLVFKKIECKYAFDYIEKDWKVILSHAGFHHFREDFFFRNYVRLLRAVK